MTADLDTLASELRGLDDRVEVDIIPTEAVHGCDLCCCVDCLGDAYVSWFSRYHGLQRHHVNADHLLGWISGLVLPDATPDQVQIELAA
jgi:hypothetical protein